MSAAQRNLEAMLASLPEIRTRPQRTESINDIERTIRNTALKYRHRVNGKARERLEDIIGHPRATIAEIAEAGKFVVQLLGGFLTEYAATIEENFLILGMVGKEKKYPVIYPKTMQDSFVSSAEAATEALGMLPEERLTIVKGCVEIYQRIARAL